MKLRHCGRVHGVNIASVAEVIDDDAQSISIGYCNTHLQLANPLTKVLPPQHWPEALFQLSVCAFDIP